jgi:hypothetical protein
MTVSTPFAAKVWMRLPPISVIVPPIAHVMLSTPDTE